MMKKLLVVILVLGMASIANAGLVLSINGVEAPPEMTILTSEVITLDIMVPDGQNITGGSMEIILSNQQAQLDNAGRWFPANDLFGFFPFYVLSESTGHIEITGGGLTPVAGPITILDGILLHCVESTDVIIDLHATGIVTVDGVSYQESTIFDTIILHQVPEPMTVALLGLGGLFLLRRRK
jgi:hypothetical protein